MAGFSPNFYDDAIEVLLNFCGGAINAFYDDVIFVTTRLPPDRFSIRQLLTISGVTLVRTLPVAPLNFAIR
jgi:hypothetical protein